MLRLAPIRAFAGAVLLGTLSFGGCACEETPSNIVGLAFVAPNPGSRIQLSDDTDPNTSNVQVTIKLRAVGLNETDTAGTVTLENKSDVDSDPVEVSLQGNGTTKVAIFEAFTLVSGSNELEATLTHSFGASVTTTASFSVVAPGGPVCRFAQAPNGPSLSSGATLSDDLDVINAGFQTHIGVNCAGEGVVDGLTVGLNVQGAATALSGTLSGGSVVFNNVSLPEGSARLTTYVLINQDQAGTASLDLNVDTGRCDVSVTSPANGTPILAANDADPSTPDVADVDVVVASARCGSGSTVTMQGGADAVTGTIGDDGSATLRIVLAQSENSNDLQNFTAVVSDQSASRNQGSSLRQVHLVDTVAPGLEVVGIAEDGSTVLTASDDQDANPLDDLTYRLQVRATNYDDVDFVYARVGDDEAGVVSATPNELGVATLDVRMPAGAQTLTVYATDAAGNQTSVVRQVEVDITVPVVTLLQPLQSGAVLANADADPDTEGFQLDCYVSIANFSTISGLDPRVFCELQTLDDQGNATGPWVASSLAVPEAREGDVGVGGVRLTLPDGQWGIRAGAVTRGGSGNSAQPSSPLNLNVDGTAPTIAFARPSNGSVIAAGNASIELAITDAEEGQSVAVSVTGGAQIPAAVVDANGRALIDGVVWAEQDGAYTLTADVSDSAGNPAPQASISVTIDGTSPGVTLLGLDGSAEGSVRDIVADGTLNATQNLNLDWGADVGNGFQYGFRVVVTNEPVGQAVTLRLNGSLINGATVDSDGSQVATFSNNGVGFDLLEGDNGLSATVIDRAGNTTTANAVVTVTTGQPFVRILNPADGSQTNANQVAVNASSNAADGAACSLVARLDGQADVTANANAAGDGAIDFGNLVLGAEGAWSLTGTCPFAGRDPVNSIPSVVTVDQTPPVLTLTGIPQINGENVFTASDAPDSTQGNQYRRNLVVSAASNGACTVSGANPSASLSVTGGGVGVNNVARTSFTPGNDCSFTFSAIALADEVNDPNSEVTVTVTASDLAGNEGSANAVILVDRVGPELVITSPADNAQLGAEDDTGRFVEGFQYSVTATQVAAARGTEASLLVNDQVLATANVADNLQFNSVTFPDGQHVLAVTASDTYGNVGTSAPINIEVDATAPTISIFNPRADALYGINLDTNGQLAGFQVVVRMGIQGVQMGTQVEVLNADNDVLGQGALAAATLEIPNVTVPEGTHTLTARVNDGINSATDTVTVTIDVTRPTVSDCTWVGDDGAQQGGFLVFNQSEDADVNTAGWQGSCTATVSGQADDATVTMLSNNPAPDTDSGTGGIANGTATISGSLRDGDHTVTLQVADAAGNTNEPGAGMVVRVDVTPPTSAITSPANGASLLAAADSDPEVDGMQTTVSVSTDAEAGTTVSIRSGEVELATATVANGAASAALTLPEGVVSLTAVATDEAANTTTSSAVSVTVDSIAPVIAITSPAADTVFGDDNDIDNGLAGFQADISVSASQVENGQRVSVRSTVGGERCSANTTGEDLVIRCTLLEGANQQLTAVVADTSGNETTSAALAITLDLTAPTLLFTTPDSNPANLNASNDADNGADGLQYSFVLASDATGQTVTLTEGVDTLGTGIVANGAVTIGPVTLTEGSHNLQASVTQDGNTSQTDLTVVVDVTAPTITLTSPAASPTIYTADDDQQGGAPLNTSFEFSVTGAVGGTLSGASSQAASIDTVAVNADGAVTITGATLNNGLVHEVTFTVTDPAGNTAEALLTATVDVVSPNAMALTAAVQDKRTRTVRLDWSEPGDDADSGVVTGYQVRHSANAITAGNFGSAIQATEAMVPQAAGAAFQVDISGVAFDDSSVSIAARAVDDVGNLGALDNTSIVSVNTELTEAEFQPAGTSAKWGWDICQGDFNGDGRDDVVVTDRDYESNGNTVGAVFIYYGQANAANLTPTIIPGTVTGGRFGNFCTSADFNGDNFDDLIVSSFTNTDGGKAYVFNGSAQGASVTATTTVQGTGNGYFGYSVSARGSVVGDATVDLAVSAILADGQSGIVYFFDGDTIAAGGTVPIANATATFTGAVGSRAGLVMVSGRDVVGDEANDVVMSCYKRNSGAGGVYVLAGTNGGLSGSYTEASPNVTVIEGTAGGEAGYRLTVGNVVGSAKDDILYNNGTGEIVWRVHAGGETINQTPTLTLSNPGNNARFWYASQQGTCDIDGDGYDEVIIGAETKAYVFFGHQNGADFNAASDRVYDLGAGYGLGICADANGDSAIDLAVVRTVSGGSWRLRY